LIDEWRDPQRTLFEREIELTTGFHRLEVHYYEAYGAAEISLSWIQIGPSTTPTPTPAPGPTRTPTPIAEAGQTYLPLIGKPTPGPCARYEPNDSLASASVLPGKGTIEAALCLGDPDDYYYVELESTARLQLDLTNIPPGTDYDLYLYRDTQEIAHSDKPGTSDEHIEITLAGGKYFIRVYPRSGRSSQAYKLTVKW
jgi:hypothetical protein